MEMLIRELSLRIATHEISQLADRLADRIADKVADSFIPIITSLENRIMATLADIETEVAESRTVQESAIALINGLSQQLKDAMASNDPAAMQKIVDDLDANSAALAAAVSANTPTAPEPQPEPEPDPQP